MTFCGFFQSEVASTKEEFFPPGEEFFPGEEFLFPPREQKKPGID